MAGSSGSSGGGGGAGAMLGISAIGAIGDAYGAYEAGQMQKATMDFNAKVAQKQAEITKQADVITQYKMKQKMDLAIADQQTAYAASGVVAMTGSALDVMVSSMSNAMLDMAIDRYNTEVAARGLQAQATTDTMQGEMYAAAGNAKAASTIASAASDYAMTQLQPSKK